jgi:diacylglycerol kinase family enzyme
VRILVAINDKAGSGDAGLYEFVRYLGLDGHEIVLRFTSGDRRAEDLVADACEFDRVVAAGGDGTVSAICYATRGTNVPVLVYPAGTGNLLAANLGMPLDAPELAGVLTGGAIVGFDLGEMEHVDPDGHSNCTGFAVIAGAGYDATIMEGAQQLKPTLGSVAYLLSAVANPTPTPATFEVFLDDERVVTDGIAVLVVNFARIQFDLPVTPDTDPRDGRFEVAVVRSKNVVGLIPVVAAAVLDLVGDFPDRSPGLEVYKASRVRVSADPALRMQSDGDALDTFTPFSARVLPQAATLLVPAASPYAAGRR